MLLLAIEASCEPPRLEIEEANRDKAFPRTFEHVSVVEGQEVRRRKILFGDLLERVDRHLELFDLETLHARIHHSPMMKSIRSARLAAVSPCSVGGIASMTLSQMAERLFLEVQRSRLANEVASKMVRTQLLSIYFLSS